MAIVRTEILPPNEVIAGLKVDKTIPALLVAVVNPTLFEVFAFDNEYSLALYSSIESIDKFPVVLFAL